MDFELDVNVGQLIIYLVRLVCFAAEVEDDEYLVDQVEVGLILLLLLSEVDDVSNAEVLAVRLAVGARPLPTIALAAADPCDRADFSVRAALAAQFSHFLLLSCRKLVEANIAYFDLDDFVILNRGLIDELSNSDLSNLSARDELGANILKIQFQDLLDVVVRFLEHGRLL